MKNSSQPLERRSFLPHLHVLKSCFFTEFGDLYMWGWNESGQLGLAVNHDSGDDGHSTCGQVQCQTVPVPVDIPGDLDVLTVSCGTRHTAALAGMKMINFEFQKDLIMHH